VIRILVADDHPVVRRGLKQIVAQEPDMAVLGEAQNGQETLDLVRNQEWDIVVFDLSMPGRGGLETLRELKRIRRNLPVLVLSIHPPDQFAARVYKAGAAGYLTKESAPAELVRGIRKVIAGGHYVSPSVAEQLAVELEENGGSASHESLSDREYEVLRLIGAGKTVNQIADALALSVKTVSTYRARILEKMKMKTTAELIRYAIQHHLVD
jgi:DNA-binding NarL/FixJ family response regulator